MALTEFMGFYILKIIYGILWDFIFEKSFIYRLEQLSRGVYHVLFSFLDYFDLLIALFDNGYIKRRVSIKNNIPAFKLF